MSTSSALDLGVRDGRARYAAVAALMAVAVVWGLSFAVVKDTVTEVAPARLVCASWSPRSSCWRSGPGCCAG